MLNPTRSSLFFIIVILLSISMLSGCLFNSGSKGSEELVESPATLPATKNEAQIVTDFNGLLEKSPQTGEVIAFIDANMDVLSPEELTNMIEELEAIQEQGLVGLEEKYTSSGINEKLNEVFSPDFYLKNIDSVKDEEIKELLNETQAAGFKIEVVEGTFVPNIDYEIYQKYIAKVNEDIKSYLEIMTVESKQVPAKDAALLIKWDEIINRALAQERFIKNHGTSKKINKVKELHDRYIYFIFFGTDNTPLFSRETKAMDQDAKRVYNEAINTNKESELIRKLSQYMEILAETDYKISNLAETYRNNLIAVKK